MVVAVGVGEMVCCWALRTCAFPLRFLLVDGMAPQKSALLADLTSGGGK